MSEQLRPCPFCGSEAQVTGNGREYWVECLAGDCKSTGRFHEDDSIARVAWNRRAVSAAKDAQHEDVVVEQMARAMNIATDGHDRYWTGYMRSAEAAYRVVMKALGA
jgi:hypothetical protein